jgi:HSP20 family protein
MLMRFDPFRELDRVAEQMWGGTPAPTFRALAMDAYRRGDQFWVHFDLPGIDPNSVDVTVERNVLTLRADRPSPRRDGDDVLVAERPHGTFTRQLFLGETLDAEHIEASYHDGVLTLVIPVAEAAKPRKVEINAASGEPTSIETTSQSA